MIANYFTNNWPYKVGSVIVASLLWLGLVEEPELATSVQAPLQYRNVPKDLEMTSDVSDQVQLELRGPASKLAPAAVADTRVLLDLGQVTRAGEQTFPVNARSVRLPPGVALDRAAPSQVRLRFEPRLIKQVPVRLRIHRRPPEGREIRSQSVTPSVLSIVGPESRVARIESIDTDGIDLDHLREGAETFRVHAYLTDPNVRFQGEAWVSARIEVK